MTDEIALRCHIPGKRPGKTQEAFEDNGIVLVFDTETTTDEKQTLMFGSYGVWVYGKKIEFGIFYNPDLPRNDIDIITKFGLGHKIPTMPLTRFIDIFYHYIFESKGTCVGFNLPFDISRIARSCRYSRRQNKGGFTFVLDEYKRWPEITILSRNSKQAFIEFRRPARNRNVKRKYYKGQFVDLRTLTFALTNNSYTLEQACKDFGCDIGKTTPEEHGKVSPDYIEYNINDVVATHELYTKAIDRFRKYKLNVPPNLVYSPASMGKALLRKICVDPFMIQHPDFPPDLLGHLMTAYYGGRCEVRIRKEPIKVSYLDFTSMYPSVYVLSNADAILKAESIEVEDVTEEIQQLLNDITPNDIIKPELWSRLMVLCRLCPHGLMLPLRSRYGGSQTYGIGVNKASGKDIKLWYTIHDVIASKFMSGVTPVIDKAVRYVPKGRQSNMKNISPLGLDIDPDDDLIKQLIEMRLDIKEKMKTATGDEYHRLDIQQNALKILANTICYGIFIEVNPENKSSDVDVYGLDHHQMKVKKTEKVGPYYNPMIGVFMTAGARLMLATAETIVEHAGGYFAYCDTDSVFISPEHVEMVQNFFRPLNPYDRDVEMIKVETDDEGMPLHDVWFYGISAKRYVLYDMVEDASGVRVYRIRKHSAHGLGHLLKVDEQSLWTDILTMHYNPASRDAILRKYGRQVAVSQLTVSKASVHKRFATLNKGKSYSDSIKPFNFILVGTACEVSPSGELVHPMLPYISPSDKRFSEIPYMPFIDYKSGISSDDLPLDSKEYWKSLSQVVADYQDHAEAKSVGEVGWLARRSVTVKPSGIRYIGKEANELETAMVLGVSGEEYVDYTDYGRWVAGLTPEEGRQLGIHRGVRYYWRNQITDGPD